jgi:segregation and condensation protein A
MTFWSSDMSADTCRVTLELFEGPLDLLLYLIRRDELDIYDVPVAHVANQYLDYIRTARELNLDVASEYLVMAATLTSLKSRSLLPRRGEGEEEEDPRALLLRQLVLYRAFRNVSAELREIENVWRGSFAGPGERRRWSRESVPLNPGQASILDLVGALDDLQAVRTPPPPARFTRPRMKLSQCIRHIEDSLRDGRSMGFRQLVGEGAEPRRIIYFFLALLELAVRGRIVMRQSSPLSGLIIACRGAAGPGGASAD